MHLCIMHAFDSHLHHQGLVHFRFHCISSYKNAFNSLSTRCEVANLGRLFFFFNLYVILIELLNTYSETIKFI